MLTDVFKRIFIVLAPKYRTYSTLVFIQHVHCAVRTYVLRARGLSCAQIIIQNSHTSTLVTKLGPTLFFSAWP